MWLACPVDRLYKKFFFLNLGDIGISLGRSCREYLFSLRIFSKGNVFWEPKKFNCLQIEKWSLIIKCTSTPIRDSMQNHYQNYIFLIFQFQWIINNKFNSIWTLQLCFNHQILWKWIKTDAHITTNMTIVLHICRGEKIWLKAIFLFSYKWI